MANRILLSWLAIFNDFKENKINEMGPTVNMHAYHWDYDFHILLYTRENETKALQMFHYLKKYFSNQRIKLIKIEIERVHIDLSVITSKMEAKLMQYSEYQIDLLLSTGTGLMKIAWFLVHNSLKLDTRLIQILSQNDSKDILFPDLHIIDVEKSSTPVSAIIREKNLRKKDIFRQPFISKSLKNVYSKAFKIAQADNVSVLILGNTGTGKEVLANYIHNNSARKHKPFITVNCSAFSDQLLESRLFGHTKGSFTGAYSNYKGVFEQANGGTVFLDEIGDINMYMQQTLLRFLQEKEIQPIGGKTKRVDVRIIAATNKNMKNAIAENKFRADLFFRLGIILDLPNFVDEEINEKNKWIDFFIDIKQREFKRKFALKLENKVRDFLLSYSFPGNIRELINIIDNLYVFDDKIGYFENLPHYSLSSNSVQSMKLADIEKIHISKILQQTGGNKSKTAEILGIVYNTLIAKMKKYNLD